MESRQAPRLIGLVLALLAGGWVLTLPQPPATTRPVGQPTRLADVWPQARLVEFAARLPDGRAYTPWFFLGPQTSVGTALTNDGAAVRLVVRDSTGAPEAAVVRELQRLPSDENPQFNGLTAAGDDLVWMVAVADADGQISTTLYRANWRTGGPAVRLTADTGDTVFFNSAYDLVVAQGRVHWAAAARSEDQQTELRSVPLTGGSVAVRRVAGAFARSVWPWLTSLGSGQAGPVDIVNELTGERRRVPASDSELVTCNPTWCRVAVLGPGGGAARVDIMRVDGSGRQRVAGGAITPAVLDVALADRYEVLSLANPTGSDTGSLKLMLYDITTARTVELAPAVATVLARGPILWWSTGEIEAVTWYVLDLRQLLNN